MANESVPIEACEGWFVACSFCDKRFPSWLSVDEEEALDKVPEKPGAFMFAFESKQRKEVVSIGMHQSNIQQAVFEKLPALRQQICQKKSKETKSRIILRWTIFKSADNKEACSLYAHWFNSGTLPRLEKEWPGQDSLQNGSHFNYYDSIKKWCHQTKVPTWRKPKTVMHPHAVPKCKSWTEPCSFCDGALTPWVPTKDCIDKGIAPKTSGFYMFAANRKGKREVVLIEYCQSLQDHIRSKSGEVKYAVERSKIPTSMTDVRWTESKDVASEESCFLYAHWYNAGTKPIMMSEMLGTDVLAKSEKFSLRNKDQQWCFGNEPAPRMVKNTKSKIKRLILEYIDDELLQSNPH